MTSGIFGLDVLPSPLERTGGQLIEVLLSRDEIEQINLVADTETQARLEKRIVQPGA